MFNIKALILYIVGVITIVGTSYGLFVRSPKIPIDDQLATVNKTDTSEVIDSSEESTEKNENGETKECPACNCPTYKSEAGVVIKEVPIEVIKEVIKEVEVIKKIEVVKEVPIEIIKEIVVIKEVPVEKIVYQDKIIYEDKIVYVPQECSEDTQSTPSYPAFIGSPEEMLVNLNSSGNWVYVFGIEYENVWNETISVVCKNLNYLDRYPYGTSRNLWLRSDVEINGTIRENIAISEVEANEANLGDYSCTFYINITGNSDVGYSGDVISPSIEFTLPPQ